MQLGREKIFTDINIITRENLIPILTTALSKHALNRAKEDELWQYYKGKTPILEKTKQYREEINNIITENRAMQITEFYQGYIFGEPVQYVCRGEDEEKHKDIQMLNDLMVEKNKTALDDELAEYMLVMGVCPRLVLPYGENCNLYTLDPRDAFNVYYNGLGEEVVMSVKITKLQDGTVVNSIYTRDRYYEVILDQIVREEINPIGMCPMVEYSLNNVRMGIFEPVISILDGIDRLQSNRMDDVEQFVESILTIYGGEISEDTLSKLKTWGALSLPQGVDAKYLTSQMSQNDIQTLKTDLMSAVVEITGMPNRNGGSSTSDTGSAVMLRDGWETADAKSKRIEIQFKKAERQMLNIVFRILNEIDNVLLSNKDIDIRFTRRNYENIQTKAQVLVSVLKSEQVNPELAFQMCGAFSDPLLAYEMSKPYIEKYYEAKQNEANKVSEV